MVRRTLIACLISLGACATSSAGPAATRPPTATEAAAPDPVGVLASLEAGIEAGTATDADREQAYERLSGMQDDGSPAYAFARAAVTGRLAELRGLGAGKLVTEAETYARLARERDPANTNATRMLGTLYVMAPGRLVKHGDAEDGLSMLEDLAEAHPEDPRNPLRAAEAFVALDDPDPAGPYLCAADAKRAELRSGDRALLDSLLETLGGKAGLGCPS